MKLISPVALGVACVWAEARGEPFEGKVAVAEVILRRTRLRYFSHGTVASTVLWPFQFSCLNTTDPQRLRMFDLDDADPVVQECVLAWYAAKAGSSHVPGAVLYHATSIEPPAWAKSPKVRRVAQIHRHVFYADLSRHKEP
jgi:N-acetylmuramoyl-L-alanine amidase